MAIRVRHAPDAKLSLGMAHQAGVGRKAQRGAEFGLRVRALDQQRDLTLRQIAQRAAEFDTTEQRQWAAQLRGADEFDASLELNSRIMDLQFSEQKAAREGRVLEAARDRAHRTKLEGLHHQNAMKRQAADEEKSIRLFNYETTEKGKMLEAERANRQKKIDAAFASGRITKEQHQDLSFRSQLEDSKKFTVRTTPKVGGVLTIDGKKFLWNGRDYIDIGKADRERKTKAKKEAKTEWEKNAKQLAQDAKDDYTWSKTARDKAKDDYVKAWDDWKKDSASRKDEDLEERCEARRETYDNWVKRTNAAYEKVLALRAERSAGYQPTEGMLPTYGMYEQFMTPDDKARIAAGGEGGMPKVGEQEDHRERSHTRPPAANMAPAVRKHLLRESVSREKYEEYYRRAESLMKKLEAAQKAPKMRRKNSNKANSKMIPVYNDEKIAELKRAIMELYEEMNEELRIAGHAS